MTIAELDTCLAIAEPVPNAGPPYKDPPCPPNKMSPHWWEENRWQQIDNLLWPKKLLEDGVAVQASSRVYRAWLQPCSHPHSCSNPSDQARGLPVALS